MNILSTRDYGGDKLNLPRVTSMESVVSSVFVDSEFSHHSYYNTFYGSKDDKEIHGNHMRKFFDLSVVPAPISLPSLWVTSASGDRIILTRWWPDEKNCVPPRLMVLTADGALVIHEMPPTWSVLEPPMPSYNPF